MTGAHRSGDGEPASHALVTRWFARGYTAGMSRAARSLFVFGIYIVVVGLALVAAPDFLMRLLRLPPATAGWARIVGLLTIVLGSYDITGSRAECRPYIRASVPLRLGFAAGTIVLVLAGQMPVTVALLGSTDIAGALWTSFALRS